MPRQAASREIGVLIIGLILIIGYRAQRNAQIGNLARTGATPR